jgi:ribosomal protein L37AE/L43A
MQEALLAVAVILAVYVVGEIATRRRRPTRCPTCGSTSVLVLRDSNVMRECNDCGKIFSL